MEACICWPILYFVLILFCKASADSSSYIRQPAPPRDGDPGFDLLLLVRTWPPTFCEQLREQREECTAPPLQEFTLHGLWPEYSSGGWPQYCSRAGKNDRKGYESETGEFLRKTAATSSYRNDDDIDGGKVRCEWPSFHGSTLNFWDHEWDKHGTCAAPLLGNRTEFFKTVVNLHDQFNLNRLFRSQGLWPVGNSQGIFDSTEAAQAVEEAWGVKPKLACHKGSLAEVWICLDLNLKTVGCPVNVKPGQMCGNQFRMPPGTQVIIKSIVPLLPYSLVFRTSY
jgi:ribonuclease T2